MNRRSALTAALCFGLLVALPAAAADPKAADDIAPPPPLKAVELGRFSIRDLRPAEGVKLRLAFTLYANVEAESFERTAGLVEKRRHRIRNAVLTAIRTAEQSDFQQPGLERLRRRVFVRLQRVEPQLPVQELLIGEFEYFVD